MNDEVVKVFAVHGDFGGCESIKLNRGAACGAPHVDALNDSTASVSIPLAPYMSDFIVFETERPQNGLISQFLGLLFQIF